MYSSSVRHREGDRFLMLYVSMTSKSIYHRNIFQRCKLSPCLCFSQDLCKSSILLYTVLQFKFRSFYMTKLLGMLGMYIFCITDSFPRGTVYIKILNLFFFYLEILFSIRMVHVFSAQYRKLFSLRRIPFDQVQLTVRLNQLYSYGNLFHIVILFIPQSQLSIHNKN